MKKTYLTCVIFISLILLTQSIAAAQSGLKAAARKEGKIVLYSSAPVWVNDKLGKAFKNKHGLKVETFRGGSLKVLQKFMNEKEAGMVKADVFISMYVPAYKMFKEKGYAMQYFSPEGKAYPSSLKDPDGYFYPVRNVVICMAYNPNIVKAADAPKTWKDIINPKWKNLLVASDYMYGSTQLATWNYWLQTYGVGFIQQLAENNPMVVSSNGNAAKTLLSGERPVVILMNAYDTWSKAKKGLPVVNVYPEQVPLVPGYGCVLADAPHPNAGKLFLDFLLSEEGQTVIQSAGYYSARPGMPPIPGKPKFESLNFYHSDWPYIEKNSKEIQAKISKALGRK